jgi:hypothetical protein
VSAAVIAFSASSGDILTRLARTYWTRLGKGKKGKERKGKERKGKERKEGMNENMKSEVVNMCLVIVGWVQ